MLNEVLFIVTVFFCLGSVLILYSFFGKNGLFAFAIFGTLLGNIAVCKCINLFGISTTAGTTLYASTFLVTDILSEKYSKNEAAKAVKYSFSIMILWLIGTQLILLFAPNANDYVNKYFIVVFGLVPRITIASLVGFIFSQNIDVFLYHFIWKKTGGNERKLWIRNNGSTLCSQAVDSLIFTTLAFGGNYPVDEFMSILLSTYFFKVIVAILDTPFIYIARRLVPRDE